MEKDKRNSNIFIVVLLVIIIVIGIILALKMTNIIKTKEETQTAETDYYEENQRRTSEEIVEEYKKEQAQKKTFSIIYNVTSIVIAFVVSLGMSKLYKKLGLPGYVVTFTLIYPILTIISGLLNSGFLKSILSLAYSILGILSMYHYFQAVGMSGKWAILLFVTAFIFPIALSTLITALFIGGISSMKVIGALTTVTCVALLIIWYVAYVKSNIKLAEMFNKSKGFTIALCILPFIFQPVLGYSKKDNI